MKKLLSIIALFIGIVCNAQVWPNGYSTPLVLSAGAASSFTIANNMNHVASITTLTASTTLSLTVNAQLKPGAIILLAVKTTSTETTTFTGAIIAPVVTGVAGKTWTQAFIYNGTNFYPCGAKIQID